MIITICGDLQIENYNLFNYEVDGKSIRLLRFVKLFDFISGVMTNNNSEHLICVGDIFNKLRPSYEELNFFIDLIIGWKKFIYLINANHDSKYDYVRDLNKVIATSPLYSMTYGGIIVTYSASTNIPTGLFLQPYTKDYQVIEDNILNCKEKIVVGHFDIKGKCFTRNGVNLSKLKDADKRYFLGHYHDPEVDKNVIFVGAPMQNNFSDSVMSRGIYTVDTDTGTYKFHEFMSDLFITCDEELPKEYKEDEHFYRVYYDTRKKTPAPRQNVKWIPKPISKETFDIDMKVNVEADVISRYVRRNSHALYSNNLMIARGKEIMKEAEK